jgi:hypothetical protein
MLYGIVIPLCLLFVPWLLVRYVFVTPATRGLPYLRQAGYLWLSAAVWAGAVPLPRFLLFGDTNTFLLHFLGGVVAALLFRYVLGVYGLKFAHWWQTPGALYLFASGLGVANEIFELFLTKVQWLGTDGSYFDTWWDLVANTLGATFGWLLLRLFRR